MAIIYSITNIVNGKQYVGVTRFSLSKRFKEHCHDAKSDKCKNRPLYLDMNKYGVEKFIINKLEECSDEDKFLRETYWINKLDTYHNGYNYTFGGSGKQFYDYKTVSDKYLELGTVKAVCEILNCDKYTVRMACRENNINIVKGQEHSKINCSKPVEMLDRFTNSLLKVFDSTIDAGVFLGDKEKSKPKTEPK